MERAVTALGQQLQDDFGAYSHEVAAMVEHFEELAFALGLPPGEGLAIEPWMRSCGIDPDSVWRTALKRARTGGMRMLN